MMNTMSDTHVGVSDIGRMFGVTRQRAYALTRKPDFPQPITDTSSGRAWLRADVAAWGTTWDRGNQGGRPRKPEAAAP